MPPKPHRLFLERVSGYAADAVAYVRRRRQSRQPFARVYFQDGSACNYGPETPSGERLQHVSEDLIGRVERLSRS